MSKYYITDNYTKDDIIELAQAGGYLPSSGDFWSAQYSELDGSGVKQWLINKGFKIIHNEDLHSHGVAITNCGIKVSTNGHCSLVK